MTTQSNRATSQVTSWLRPNDTIEVIIDATLMRIPQKSWLQLEIERWADRNGREAWAQENKEGMVALFCWADEQKEVGPEET